MGLKINFVDQSEDLQPIITVSDIEGVTMKPFGASKGTSTLATGLCGFKGMIDLLPFAESYQFGGNDYFKPLMDAFVHAGY